MSPNKKRISFETGCAVNNNMFYAAGSIDDLNETDFESFSRMNFFQELTREKWFFHDLPNWRVVSACLIKENSHQPRTVVALDENGYLEYYNRNGSVVEKIIDAGVDEKSKGHGYLSRLKILDGTLYACGLSGQVYARVNDEWIHKDQGILQLPPKSTAEGIAEFVSGNTSLNDLGILPNGNLIAVGDSGFVAQLAGGKWNVLKMDFDENLNSIFVENSETIWICGFNGALLKGNFSSGFKDLSSIDDNNYFQSICKFGETLYIGSSDGVFEFDGNKIRKAPGTAKFNLKQISYMESIDGVLWVLSNKLLVRFNEKQWEAFTHPDNL